MNVEKLMKVNNFFLIKKLIIVIPQPSPWLATVLTGLCTPLSDITSQPSCHSHLKRVKQVDCWECKVQGHSVLRGRCELEADVFHYLHNISSQILSQLRDPNMQQTNVSHPYPLLAPDLSCLWQCIFTPSPEPTTSSRTGFTEQLLEVRHQGGQYAGRLPALSEFTVQTRKSSNKLRMEFCTQYQGPFPPGHHWPFGSFPTSVFPIKQVYLSSSVYKEELILPYKFFLGKMGDRVTLNFRPTKSTSRVETHIAGLMQELPSQNREHLVLPSCLETT